METDNLSKKWLYLRRILERSGPFDSDAFLASPDNLDFLNNTCKILVIGNLHKTLQCFYNNSLNNQLIRCWWFRL